MPQENTSPPIIAVIPLKELHTPSWNPRQFMDESKMQDLMAYLKNGGVVPRIWVWKGDGKVPHEVISGQRRCVAYERLGRTEIEAEILDIPLEEAKILAITTNQDEGMHWWDWYKAIGRMAGEHDWNQRELASRLGCSQSMVSRAVQILEALNPEAQAQLDLILINKNPTNTHHFELPESVVYTLTSLAEIPPKGQKDNTEAKKRLEASWKKAAVALKMVIDREMTEAKAKYYVGWIKQGNDPAKYPLKGPSDSKKGPKIDPNDPNGELWKVVPDWFRIKYQPKSEYGIATKGDKFGAPAAVYAYLSTMMEHFQRVQRVVNPEAIPANPFKDKVKELFEKGVREALESSAHKQKECDEKHHEVEPQKSRHTSGQAIQHPVAESENHATGHGATGNGAKPVELAASEAAETKSAPEELPVNPNGSLKSPVTEGELKTITDLLGSKEVKDNLKKMFGGLFEK